MYSVIRTATSATAIILLLCACGSKDSSGSGGSGASSFSLGAKSPGNEMVDALNGLSAGSLDPMLDLMVADTTGGARVRAGNVLADRARSMQAAKARATLVSENVTGDIATVTVNITGQDESGRAFTAPSTSRLVRI
jgi:hypothetical protein